ncbi:hypothetical protein Taro_025374 [Colocasia esculenta]|uniref:Uncharacterized protein n=1 Tax=Colocasia esculenta TaxID=4460 RepID=A0A843VHD7_COLES|nr:hypothetical protein [Colocasia esculenta]
MGELRAIGDISPIELSWLDWAAEVSFRSSSRRSLASPSLTASLFAAPEPLREARRGTVVWPDYDGYCWVRLLSSGRARAGLRRRGGSRGPRI